MIITKEMYQSDCPWSDELSKTCNICGEREPTAFWNGSKTVCVCDNCSKSILPKLIVDAAFTIRTTPDLTYSEGKNLINRIEMELWKAITHKCVYGMDRLHP